jgi:hypothetical protein
VPAPIALEKVCKPAPVEQQHDLVARTQRGIDGLVEGA